jgi:hypothetical protein
LRSGIAAQAIHDVEEYHSLITAAGFAAIAAEDLSAWWCDLLRERLEMFRAMDADTVARFGRQRHQAYLTASEFFAGRSTEGRLGGARLTTVTQPCGNIGPPRRSVWITIRWGGRFWPRRTSRRCFPAARRPGCCGPS